MAKALAASIFGLVAYWILAFPGGPSFGGLGDPVSGKLHPAGWVLGYAVTLVGVLLGAGFRRVLRLQNQGHVEVPFTTLMRDTLRSTDLWLGLFGSPLLFALIVKTLEGLDLTGIVAVALQNGFFCATIVTEMVNARGADAQPIKPSNGA